MQVAVIAGAVVALAASLLALRSVRLSTRILEQEAAEGRAIFETAVDGIITIDQSGPECAFAKVMIALGENRYTDYLTLLKLDGRWQVIGKTFTAVPRPGVEPL